MANNTWIDPATGNTYREETTSTETLPDGTVITQSWVLVSTPDPDPVS